MDFKETYEKSYNELIEFINEELERINHIEERTFSTHVEEEFFGSKNETIPYLDRLVEFYKDEGYKVEYEFIPNFNHNYSYFILNFKW